MGEQLDDIARWQYCIVNLGSFGTGGRLGMALSYFGSQGWELVTIYDKASNWFQGMEKGFILFKRPVPPGDEPDGPWAQVWTADQVLARYKATAGETAPS
jgi:hypothetical protein